MQIDCYGFSATSEFFKRKSLDVHLLKKGDDGECYMCFGDEPNRPVHRLDRTADGAWRIMWAFGKWDEAPRLAYVPINETLEVEDELWR